MGAYVFELNRDIKCCFDCPLLGNDWCHLAKHDNWDEKDVVPSWCPLQPFEHYLAKEWYENANSQPEMDEQKQTVRLELYESEWEKVGLLSLRHRLTVAQMIAKLIEEAT